MGWTKGSKKHKLGNIVSGLLTIIDGVVLTLTIGNYSPNFVLKWNIHRRSTGVLCDNKIE
jgi:hypothetical protein